MATTIEDRCREIVAGHTGFDPKVIIAESRLHEDRLLQAEYARNKLLSESIERYVAHMIKEGQSK